MQSTRIRTYFLLLVLAAAFVAVLSMFKPFLVTLSLAAIFAALLYPLYLRLLKVLFNLPWAAGLATLAIAVLCVLTPLSILASRVLIESEQLYTSLIQDRTSVNVREIVISAGDRLESFAPGSAAYAAELSGEIDTYAKQALTWLIQHLSVAFSGVVLWLLHLFIFLMALYYFLVEGPRIKHAVVRFSPLHDKDDRAVMDSLRRTVDSVVKGTLVIAIIQGVVASAGFILFGVPNPLLWGMTTSIAALIPGVGTSLVVGPAIIYLFATGHVLPAVGLLAWGIFAVGLIDNFLGPRLMGKGAQLHPLAILLAVLGGVALLGPAGVFLGPVMLSFLLALFAVYSRTVKEADDVEE